MWYQELKQGKLPLCGLFKKFGYSVPKSLRWLIGNPGWTYEQLFNTLDDGNLHGQDSWSGDTSFQVQTTTKYEGAKAVSTTGGDPTKIIERTITGVSDGTVYFVLRVAQTNLNGAAMFFNNGTTQHFGVYMLATGKISFYNGTGNIDMLTYSANVWYPIALEFDSENDRVRCKVYSSDAWGAWTDWQDVQNSPMTEINKMRMFSDAKNGTAYFDTITPNDPTVVSRRRSAFFKFF